MTEQTPAEWLLEQFDAGVRYIGAWTRPLFQENDDLFLYSEHGYPDEDAEGFIDSDSAYWGDLVNSARWYSYLCDRICDEDGVELLPTLCNPADQGDPGNPPRPPKPTPDLTNGKHYEFAMAA